MPIYEYVCDKCKRKFSLLVGVVAEEDKPACPRCGSEKFHKIISRVFRGRGNNDALDDLADADIDNLEDPAQARKFAKRMGQELGEELGDDFEEEMKSAIAKDESGATDDDTDWSV
jgi:putative FmdB family regulatory protein